MQGGVIGGSELGRWPANVLHDGSEEVVAAFPESETSRIETSSIATGSDGWGNIQTNRGPRGYDGSGSAARFFYTAKANADDRLGSKHPTVKPVDLMQWLCRLVTPKGGTILDPFAGTGTTGEAAFREGFNAVLIESEPEYQADIRRRMALMMAGPDERLRESIKAKNLPRDDGPLFAPRENDPPPRESWDEMWARPFDWDKYNSELP
jgi:site-specific DNA-methyltransferase (adenine-specific)